VPDSHLSCLYYPETYAEAYYEEQCGISPLYDAGCVGYWDAYTDQQCSLDSLWSNSCPDFETAFLDQQCENNPTYSVYCLGYEDAIAEEEIDLEEIFVLPPPETYVEVEITLSDFQVMTEIFDIEVASEIEFEEITQEEIIAEIEAEFEEFLEPIPEVEPEPIEEIEELVEETTEEEPIEEPIEEQEEVEEDVEEVEESETEEEANAEEEQEDGSSDPGDSEEESEVMLAETKVSEKKKAKSKKDKMKEIITNKLNNLAKEMGAAVSLEEQKNLQSYILALLNYNAGFNSYNTSLVDGTFYDDKDIYLNRNIPDNQKGLRNGLANQLLHNQLVDLQWQK
jgi:hypothetical protein